MKNGEILPKYFIQSKNWLEFWKKANNSIQNGHDYFYFESENLEVFVYQYPYIFKSKFWYIPKGFNLKNKGKDSKILIDEFNDLLSNISKLAKKENCTHLKFDLDDSIANILEFDNIDKSDIVKKLNKNSDFKVIQSDKTIQYLVSSYNKIEYEDIEIRRSDDSQIVYDKTLDIFWSKCNEKIRRYTRKSIKLCEKEGFWHYSLEKTEENFEKFYKIHIETTKRQNFPTQPKSYLKDMFFQDFTKCIIISDKKGNPHCVWLGVMLENQLVYLLGGNTDLSFKKYAQYLVHVIALRICVENKIRYYDMGGYDPNEGYGKFKDGYKGKIRTFTGVFDIVLDNPKYYGINLALKLKNLIKN